MASEIKNVSVIGAGYMGKQIIDKSAENGYNVRVYDVRSEGLDKFMRKFEEKKRSKEMYGEVTFHDTLSDAVKDADLIIEAIPEKLELKREIFSKLDNLAPPHAIIATNSSSIPVSKLEESVKRKDKLLNIHFYHLTKEPMADIMRGSMTSNETFEKGKNWIKSIGIEPLVVKKECFGFVFNRIWRAIKKECLKIWAGDHADVEEVDKAWKIYTEMESGPFSKMDEIGLDVIYDIEMSYYKESGDPKDKPPQALKDMVDKGKLGMKSGKGFYDY